jgi:hypothetical protein
VQTCACSALDNPLYQFILPETRIAPKGSGVALRNYDILEFIGTDGYFRNSTVLGSITGEALDLGGVIDDPVKGRAEANSLLQRDKVWNWLTDDVFSRFSESAALLMIMTRWHVDDPAGRLIEGYGDRVTVARYPAIAEHDEKYRKKGEALPKLKSIDFLMERRKLYTEGSWQALYQQSPIIIGGGIFPIEKLATLSMFDRTRILKSVRYWDKAGRGRWCVHRGGIAACTQG